MSLTRQTRTGPPRRRGRIVSRKTPPRLSPATGLTHLWTTGITRPCTREARGTNLSFSATRARRIPSSTARHGLLTTNPRRCAGDPSAYGHRGLAFYASGQRSLSGQRPANKMPAGLLDRMPLGDSASSACARRSPRSGCRGGGPGDHQPWAAGIWIPEATQPGRRQVGPMRDTPLRSSPPSGAGRYREPRGTLARRWPPRAGVQLRDPHRPRGWLHLRTPYAPGTGMGWSPAPPWQGGTARTGRLRLSGWRTGWSRWPRRAPAAAEESGDCTSPGRGRRDSRRRGDRLGDRMRRRPWGGASCW